MSAAAADSAGLALADLLAEGCAAASAMLDTLAAERAALEAQDAEALGVIAERKAGLLGALESVERRRRALPDRPTADPAWPRYLDLARACRQHNASNGAIIRLRQQHISSALAALAGSGPQTYGPSGHAGQAPSRALAEA